MTPRLSLLPSARSTYLLSFAGVLALALLSVQSPRLALEAAGGLAIFVVTFWRLDIALAVFVVLTFPAKLPGVLGLGGTVAKPLAFLIVVSWVLALLSDRALPVVFKDRPALSYALVGFLIWGLASMAWAWDPHVARYNALWLISVTSLFFVSYSVVRTPARLRMVMWAYVLGATLSASYALATGGYVAGRLSGLFDPNFFATQLVAAFVFVAALFGVCRRPRTRVVILALGAVLAVAFVQTESRGGLVAAGVGVIAAIALAGRARPRVLAAALIVAAIAGTYYLEIAPAHLQQRISSISSAHSAGRAGEWQIALRMAENHPLAGVGIGNFSVAEPDYATQNINLTKVNFVVNLRLVAHNTYLQLLSELGIIGFAIFAAVVLATMRTGMSGVRQLVARGDAEAETLGRAVLIALVATLAGFFFLSALYEKQLWLLLGLVAAVAAMARATSSDARPRVRG